MLPDRDDALECGIRAISVHHHYDYLPTGCRNEQVPISDVPACYWRDHQTWEGLKCHYICHIILPKQQALPAVAEGEVAAAPATGYGQRFKLPLIML